MKEVSLNDLVSTCNKYGWEKVIKELEKTTFSLEILQANLFASGSRADAKKAAKIGLTITKQNFTIARLKELKPK
jgi:hypothetical protein